ncbi:BQ2448_7092 [Microbotryum intermedium]|uniref:BQ2448_7092 protein n=1 Tax=Microbotryum intermedium TaxID=269621 RepID=A0A238FIT9_9BASI|nr:BQ2448_7092 [Microbotryum intermedium]
MTCMNCLTSRSHLHFCDYHQDDWHDLLPLAEFPYNNSFHSSIGMTPFFASRGSLPKARSHPQGNACSGRSTIPCWSSRCPQLAQDQIRSSQEFHARYANLRRAPTPRQDEKEKHADNEVLCEKL